MTKLPFLTGVTLNNRHFSKNDCLAMRAMEMAGLGVAIVSRNPQHLPDEAEYQLIGGALVGMELMIDDCDECGLYPIEMVNGLEYVRE